MQKRPDGERAATRGRARDLIVVVLSLVALAGLAGILYLSGRDSQRAAAELAGRRSDMTAKAAERQDTARLWVNEVNADGWIELYNGGAAAAEIGGYALLLNGERLWVFEADTTLAPGGFAVADAALPLLPEIQNVLALQNAAGETVDALLLPPLPQAESYGRPADGEAGFAQISGTRGASNRDAARAAAQAVTFSAPGGFYGEELLLELGAPEGCDIHYTTDGSKPTAASQRYETPISLQNASGANHRYATARGIAYAHNYVPGSIYMGTVVRAVAVSQGKPVGEAASQSYFVSIGESAALADIPALSITVDPAHLFDYFEGIYVQGRSHEDALAMGQDSGATGNFSQDWTRRAHIEFFEAAKGKTFEADADLSILQDFSAAAPQKSFRLRLAGKRVSPGSSLHSFVAADGRTLALHTYEKDNHYKFRQATAYELLQGAAVGTPALSPCNVFLNGEHWGAYLLQQPYDEKYVSLAYGVAQSDVVTALDRPPLPAEAGQAGAAEPDPAAETPPAEPAGQVDFDELAAFVVNNDMRIPENFSAVQAQMDLDSYLDCFCANMYLANADYKAQGLTVWRSGAQDGAGYADGRWRWLMPNVGNSLANGLEGETCSYSINTFLRPAVTQDAFLAALFANGEFRARFSEKMGQMEQRFAPARAAGVLAGCSARVEQMSLSSYLRFTGQPTETFFSSEVDKVAAFFEERGNYIAVYTREVLVRGTGPVEPDEAGGAAQAAVQTAE